MMKGKVLDRDGKQKLYVQVYDILKHETLVLTRAGVEKLEARFNG